MPMVKILDCLFEADRNQQPYGDGRDVDEELCPTMNLFVRWVNVQHRCRGLTTIRLQLAIYFWLHKGEFDFKPCKMASFSSEDEAPAEVPTGAPSGATI